MREHDAMIVALARADHASTIDGAVSLGGETLDRAALVSAVLARNPDLDAARETWRAMVAAYPSAATLPDPMLRYAIAPLSIGSSVPFGQRVELSQRLPYPGKRELAGASALADAEATRADYEILRLDLAEATVQVFDDYYVAARALDINAHHRGIVERIRATALAQYSAGRGAQQDPLEADGELISLDRERLMIETQRRVAMVRINRLLHRAPDAPLPPPPVLLTIGAHAIDPATTHPKQVAATARIHARSAEIAAADRAFYPDLELMASYDSMWSDWQHQVMIGVGIEIPLQRGGRRGTVARARAAQATATAELASATDLLAEDRERGRREVDAAKAVIALDEDRALPNARTRIDAAIAGFTVGQNPFAAVVMAEHGLRDVELRLEQARAELDRKLASLDRASGRIAGGGR